MKSHLTLLVTCIAFAGCMNTAADLEDRRALGKADSYGTCEDNCGGPSDGSCWCDELCVEIGDCCEDVAEYCEIEDCEAQDAQGVGLCAAFLGFAWNGSDCVGMSGCSCEGDDCGNLRFSKQECLDAAATCEFDCPINPTTVLCSPGTVFDVEECACIPATCETFGGTCRSSSIDVTFPADCEGEFGESTLDDATCPAINQACCI